MYTFLSPEEYLRLAGRLRGLEDRRIDGRIDRFLRVFGLDVARHSRLSALSKGMRQKVLLSAALLHDPKIVILDEPTSGLDLTSMLAIRAVVAELARDKRMIFYSSHELGAIEKIASRVVILRAGRVAASGTVDELRDLTRQASLEDAFAELAVHDDIDAMAGQVLEAMRA
jgi:ABC-2 type transport system ATP-binding protein